MVCWFDTRHFERNKMPLTSSTLCTMYLIPVQCSLFSPYWQNGSKISKDDCGPNVWGCSYFFSIFFYFRKEKFSVPLWKEADAITIPKLWVALNYVHSSYSMKRNGIKANRLRDNSVTKRKISFCQRNVL